MLTITAKKLTEHLIKSEVVSSDLYDIYLYGFEVLISSLLSTLLIVIIGIITGNFLETVSFLFVFISLRSFTGGFHANKYWVCTVTTFLIYVSIMLLSNFSEISVSNYYILLPFGIIVLLLKSPISNPNKHLTKKEIKRYKFIGLVLFVFLVLLGWMLLNKAAIISNTIFYSLIADFVLMFIKSR